MEQKIILGPEQFAIIVKRLCFQLIENHDDFTDTVIIGIQPRGTFLSRRIAMEIEKVIGTPIIAGELDCTFYRDDFRRREIISPSETRINFTIEGKKVILVDDVLFTGRTVRAALDSLIDFGRPSKVELLTLIDRRFSRHLPVAPDYTGIQVDTVSTEKIKVQWKEADGEDKIYLEVK